MKSLYVMIPHHSHKPGLVRLQNSYWNLWALYYKTVITNLENHSKESVENFAIDELD